jgi:hypothetical protein
VAGRAPGAGRGLADGAGSVAAPDRAPRGAHVRGSLPEEAAALRAKYPALSPTARQAIGYAEAFDLLDGRLTRDAAIRRTIQRTAQLAKRQMTWFRHQLQVLWVDVREDDPLARTAEAVEKPGMNMAPLLSTSDAGVERVLLVGVVQQRRNAGEVRIRSTN